MWNAEGYSYRLIEYNRSIRIPKLLFGTSPFIGAGQFGSKAAYYYQRFYQKPVNITRLYMESIAKGINAIHTPCDYVIVNAVLEADNATGTNSFIMATVERRNLQNQLGLCSNQAKTILLHGSFTDSYLNEIDETLMFVKKYGIGALTGIATHNPGSIIPKVIGKPNVKVILAPVNSLGLFMDPSPESTLKAVREARSNGIIVYAMKPLAAGRLSPMEAFNYLKDKVDGLVVGVTSSQELKQVIKAAETFYA